MIRDVVLFDSVGMPYTSATPRIGPLGGSEFEQVLLIEALHKAGVSVASVNRLASHSRVEGVDYVPIGDFEDMGIECKTLVLERGSTTPQGIKAARTLRWVTDSVAGKADTDEVICVSEWQRSKIEGKTRVIPNMIPDFVYDVAPNRNTPANSFIYASSAMKGLQQTVDYFASMRKTKPFRKATLAVLNPGYDQPEDVIVEGVTYAGALPFHQVVEQMLSVRNMLYVSKFPETFCIVAVLAEILGLNLFVLRQMGPDAMSEVCNSRIFDDNNEFNAAIAAFANDPQSFVPKEPKDFRVSSVLPLWLEALQL